uniref:Flagellin A n=1 Tax=Campylobacter jejuni TaxID=197 RepID=UPI0015A75A07|nr:Chain A, Flagellin A [Campylobacter jejuni]6X80_B Chain B, Flagellin A [Campylobacter jejuni]6X80_C Chain C, Flagellin A [Campylobacter jejuni]6X80_D Chain D, Flagellin A [Campylobacter jejuni]6X80_E Chain E, Flagellin A [Campylobacter jejuni]6X80_F Chain F, Flagellin A [Campylobacter jejuni]6X80_G Chain G, Flagellin A [Campylobacter jejuni]6X80_H Chain H, Flagellin A [Campylobacter jejuni]6X80_I Chain I, Flagellin A [Campylobacter jejuni]6X80_J Chain J, Flagellin A [Campylobacter jejun
MGFRINTNVAALNAKANSDLNAKSLDASLSRLSSGLRINSAADDASGMAIADSLRSQANTLGQAISNGNDALGILQTADKAMDEQLKILDTIKTKATQAAQDGQSLKTRTMLQADINKLMEELDNIANTTSFNGKQLLSGNFTNQEFQIGASSNQTVKATIGATQSSKIGVTRFETGAQSFTSGVVGLTIKNYNGIEDFKFDNVVISTSVGTGLGALAEEINKSADKTGVRATYDVKTTGVYAIKEGTTSQDFAINGVTIGKIEYKDGDGNGSLISAINAVKDTTGVQASKDENGKLVLTSADGRGIKITGDIGVGSGILANQKENYGRLSLVKNDGRDINISGTNLSAIGMGTTDMISQSSVSLRESKGQISATNADAMGFNSYKGGGKFVFTQNVSSISAFMSAQGSGFSRGSGFSVGSGKNLSVGLSQGIQIISSAASMSNTYVVSAGSGFSSGSGNSQFAALKTTAANTTDETAGVTTLKGAMAVMDIAETAITNLDQIRADIASIQNQVTSTINNITVTQVNVKAAESQIRDVDFASESANYSKANILAQSGSYAMAQANSSQQNVLRLLQ